MAQEREIDIVHCFCLDVCCCIDDIDVYAEFFLPDVLFLGIDFVEPVYFSVDLFGCFYHVFC